MLDLNRKMCVILTNGAQYHFTTRELFTLFTRKEFISLAFSMVSLMAILDFHSLAPALSAPMRMVHWSGIAVIYIFLLFCSIVICEHVIRLFLPPGHEVRLWTLLPIFFTVVLITPIGFISVILYDLDKNLGVLYLLEDFAINFTVCVGLDAIFAIFVLPYIATQNHLSNSDHSENLLIFGEELQLSQIHYLCADGRRTLAILENKEIKISAKFSDVVERLSTQHGTLMHRSFWVPFAQITEISTIDRRTICRLRSGQILPVARSRYAHLREELHSRRQNTGESL